jgi:hypothetical protein
MLRPEVDAEVIHMCAYGMESEDEHGRGLVKKATRFLSSAHEVLKRIAARCSNGEGREAHRHVHLIQGRAKGPQVYPRALCVKICEGIAAQKRLDDLGLRARPIMSFDEMRDAAGQMEADNCPSQALHEPEGEGLVAWDDLSGQALDPALMVAARREEIKYFREMGVYDKVDLAEAWEVTGRAPLR